MSFVTLSSSELGRKALLTIAGTACVLHTNSSELIASLTLWRAGAAPSAGFRSFLRIKIRVQQDGSAARLHQPRFRGRHHLVFAIFGTANVFIFDLLKRELTATVSAATARDAHFWNAVLVPIAMGVMGPSLRTIPLHAACVVQDNDNEERGVLLAGASGAGKSTLSVALALSGLDLISDDWTYLSSAHGHLAAHGLRAPVKLLPDAVRHFPQLRQYETAISMNGELAYELPADAVFPVNMRQSCVPNVLLYLERTHDAHSYFTEWSSPLVRDYFLLNAEVLPDEMAQIAKDRSQTIEDVSRLPAFIFHSAGTPQQSAHAIKQFLGSRIFESRVPGPRISLPSIGAAQ